MDKKTSSRGDEASREREALYVEAVRNRAQAYLRWPNITSVGVGYRIRDGKPTDELAIQFTVERKLVPESLALEGMSALPTTITAADGSEIPVDVVQRSYRASYRVLPKSSGSPRVVAEKLSPSEQRRSRLATIRPGISVSHFAGSAGTLGAVVYDELNGTPYVLSNWHVLHGPTGTVGDNVVQPGPWDDGNVDVNVMGRLVRSHLGLAGDCAISTVVGRSLDPKILELGVVPERVARVHLGDEVVKSGRTTGVTHGLVARVGVVVSVDYGGDTGTAQVGGFEIAVNPHKPTTDGEISSGGDSGSLWMVDTGGKDSDVAVGLHFAGETDPDPTAEHAVACNIDSVLKKLGVSLQSPLGRPQADHAPRVKRRRARKLTT